MASKATTSLNNWKFQDQHVQQNLVGGDFIGSHSCILCATGPRLADMVNGGSAFTNPVSQTGTEDLGVTMAIPIGVIDNAQLQQSRQIAQIFEIGSKRSYILASRAVGVLQVSRVSYKGPNLLRMLYAYYPQAKIDAKTGDKTNKMQDIIQDNGTAMPDMALDKALTDKLPDIQDLPGYHNTWFNLNSDIFSQPYGMVLYFKDNNDRDVAAVFLEECYIDQHTMGISANSIVVAENVTMRYERAVPIKVRPASFNGVTTSDVSNALNSASNFISDTIGSAMSGLGGLIK